MPTSQPLRDIAGGPPASRRRIGPAAAVLALLLAGPACRGPAGALGSDPEQASGHADVLLGVLAARFGLVEREAGFDALRPKLLRAAFSPSRVFNDAKVWTARAGDQRVVELAGARAPAGYQIGVRSGPPPPAAPADYRGRLRLRALGDRTFEWAIRDELAVGRFPPGALSRAFAALLAAAEATAPGDAGRRLRHEMPRTAAAIGRLLTLEVVSLRPDPDGATAVELIARLDPAAAEAAGFPRYARYLTKYATPMVLSAVAEDAAGSRWWAVQLSELRAELRFRIRDGALAPLEGRGRGMPVAFHVSLDYATKMGPFRIGVADLVADVELVREPDEVGWRARFRREPDWQLPFLAEPLLRKSLRRPFEAEGSTLAFAVRAGEPSLITRDYRLVVQETWIVRWLGGMMDGAVTEFRRGAEQEADRFTGEALAAIRADILAFLAP